MNVMSTTYVLRGVNSDGNKITHMLTTFSGMKRWLENEHRGVIIVQEFTKYPIKRNESAVRVDKRRKIKRQIW